MKKDLVTTFQFFYFHCSDAALPWMPRTVDTLSPLHVLLQIKETSKCIRLHNCIVSDKFVSILNIRAAAAVHYMELQ